MITRAVAAGTGLVHAGRRRSRAFDHLVHAGGHYNRAQADMLAAGVTYYVFLALFPVLLLLAAVAGFVLSGDQLLQAQLTQAVREAVPGSTGVSLAEEVASAIDSRGLVGVIGLVGFLLVGLGAMDKVRTGMDVIWRGRPDPPDFLLDRVKDLGALLGFGAAGALSIALTAATTAASSRVLAALGLADVSWLPYVTAGLGLLLALAGDTFVFLWLLKGVPATPFGFRELLPGALFGAVGFEVLKAVGAYYLGIIGDNVTAQTLGGFVGLVVWINVVARFAFFTASWTATIPRIEAALEPIRADRPQRVEVPVPAAREPRTASVRLVRTVAVLVGGGALVGAAGARLLPALLRRRGRRPGS